MKSYYEILKMRDEYKNDPQTIMMENLRRIAAMEGRFNDAFLMQQKLESKWFELINRI